MNQSLSKLLMAPLKWWWSKMVTDGPGWGSTRPKNWQSIVANWQKNGGGVPAERPYIIVMPTLCHSEGFDEYAEWCCAFSQFLDCECIFFFGGIRIDVSPDSCVEGCFSQWIRTFKEIH